MGRNRSEGWSHAKKTGHENESLIMIELGIGYTINQNKVESIFGDKTIPKIDIYGPIKHSLKKSLGGQVHMNKVDRFINGYEKMYDNIPNNVKEVMFLIFGGSKNINKILDLKELIHPNQKIRNTEIRRKTLCIETLIKYDKSMYDEFILWMGDNIHNITELVFKKGWAKDEKDWVDILWYKNNIGENDVDEKFFIDEIISKSKGKQITCGNKNGGTTIQLPFGHLQYHQGGLQFHHSFSKIKQLLNN